MRQFMATQRAIKMIINAFYFILKAPFVLKNLNFCLEFLVIQKNDLIRKIMLISKFIVSQRRKQTVAISQEVKAMKFGQFNRV